MLPPGVDGPPGVETKPPMDGPPGVDTLPPGVSAADNQSIPTLGSASGIDMSVPPPGLVFFYLSLFIRYLLNPYIYV